MTPLQYQILKDIKKSEPRTYLHFGDGDYYFLTKQAIGSATPGKRALSKPYSQMNMQPFIESVLKNNYICMEFVEKETIANFHKLYPNRQIDFNLTEIYEILVNKWIIQMPFKIGLIGAEEKLDLIEKLMQRERYRKYLGINEFEYIPVAQKFLADDLEGNMRKLKPKLENSKSKVILFGIGHVKCGMAWQFKLYHNAVYIDIGAGIDALAGIYDYNRPFGNQWTNYSLLGYNYSKLDLMYFQPRDKDIWLD